ncbi:endo-1,4-beta-xylanase [Methylobacterium marchantiae]|uniref:Beta-xylanase n=1 Tax=Methylobacterium marchantiae TaxID=600331 RepID=A0ABW3WY55_9HYPH|nr:Exoglucanase/xylanase [Methylobacterium marchantiae]
MMKTSSNRRAILKGAMGGILGMGTPLAGILGSALDGLPAMAAAPRKIPFGAAVRGGALTADAAYGAALAERCRLLVPEGGLKWAVLRPNRETFDFGEADQIAAFARRNGLGLRGHTLAWYGAMPAWAEAITSRVEAEWMLTSHIETVVSRYRGFIGSWDVVNEPMPDKPASPQDLRHFVWSKTLGADYIPIAFKAAHAADPAAQLVLNEYDVEFVGQRFAMRRAGILAIARSLLDRGIPIHAIGLQGHLFADRAIDRDGLQSFLREIKAMKLDVLVTELDVIDFGLPTDFATRDALIAKKATDFLQAVDEVTPPSAVLTWGITDRYTWVPIYFTRPDGTANRPLPLDSDLRPKPLMSVIERFTGNAS